jgi:hypothetical protein
MIRQMIAVATAVVSFAGLAAALAPSAGAAGSCSILIPAKIAISSNTTVITGKPAADCAQSDMESADWSVSPSGFGDTFDFAAGSLSSSYTFYSSLDTVGTLRAVPTGASSSVGFNDLTQNTPSYTVKYATWTYSASSRSGHAVYINGLIHQWSSEDLASGTGRKSYLQRYLHGTWQTMLSRTSDAQGKFTVGFIQNTVYQYRWTTTETGNAWGTTSASTVR